MDSVQVRRECRTCKRKLPLNSENFGRHDHGRDGYHPHCRACCRVRKKAHRAARAARRAMNRPPLLPGQTCDECFDLGHRRPFAGCPRCKLAHVPLPPIELVTRRSYEAAIAT
jgi:hypothetical protein